MADRTKGFPLYDESIQSIETGFEFIGLFHLAQNCVFSSQKIVLLVFVR